MSEMRWLIWLMLCLPVRAAPDLRGVTLILDPGHGDQSCPPAVEADPGAQAMSPGGQVSECVFTWDTAMRLRRRAQRLGAEVFLTLEADDLEPHDWPPSHPPQPGRDFAFKALVGCPRPASSHEALVARPACANEIYRRKRRDSEVFFFSLHFDSTSERLAGLSFYYPEGAATGFVEVLSQVVRERGRARLDLNTGREAGLAAPARYAVLNHAENPDSYLIELGNLQARDGSDLWRMRSAEVRDEYAEMLVSALLRRGEGRVAPPPARRWRKRDLLGLALVLGLLGWVGWLRYGRGKVLNADQTSP